MPGSVRHLYSAPPVPQRHPVARRVQVRQSVHRSVNLHPPRHSSMSGARCPHLLHFDCLPHSWCRCPHHDVVLLDSLVLPPRPIYLIRSLLILSFVTAHYLFSIFTLCEDKKHYHL